MYEAGEVREGRHFHRAKRFREFLLSMNLNKQEMKALEKRIEKIELEAKEANEPYFVLHNNRLVTPGIKEMGYARRAQLLRQRKRATGLDRTKKGSARRTKVREGVPVHSGEPEGEDVRSPGSGPLVQKKFKKPSAIQTRF